MVIFGGIIILLGLLLLFGDKMPFFGQLPGDITIEKGSLKIYFPIVTFLIISVVLTILLNLLSK